MINKIKDNKKLLMLIVGIILFVILITIVCFFIFKNDLNYIGGSISPEEEKFKSEYEELNNMVSEDGKEYPKVNIPLDNNIKYTDIDYILDVFNNNGDAVIYFGYPSCIYCRNAIQVLFDTAKDMDLNAIYYLNTEDENSKNKDLLNALGDELVVNENGTREISSPLVIFVVDGKVVSYNKGTLFSQEDPYEPLDNSQLLGLSQIYRYGINDVITSIKLKNVGSSLNNQNS